VHSAGAVGLLDVTVNGAWGAGILIDSAGTEAAVVGIGRARVFGVGEGPDSLDGGVFAVGIGVRGDTVIVDSSVVSGIAGAGIGVSDAAWFAVGASQVSLVDGPGIVADTGVVLFDVFDSTRVVRTSQAGIVATDVDTVRVTDSRADSSGVAGLWVYRADLVEVDGSRFYGSGSGIVVDSLVNVAVVRNSVVRGSAGAGIWLVADSMLVENDTVAQMGGPAVGSSPFFPGDTLRTQHLTIRGGRISNTNSDGILVWGIGRLAIVGAEIDSTARCCAGSPWWSGAYLGNIDTIRVDSNSVHDNFASGVWLDSSGVFTARDNTFDRNYFTSDDGDGLTDRATVYLEDVNSADVRLNTFTGNNGAGVWVQYVSDTGVAVVDSNSFRGKYWGVRSGAWDTTRSHIEVINNSFVGDLTGPWTRQIGMGPLRTMIVESNTIDSTFGTGIGVWPGDTITVQNNVITNMGGSDGIYAERGAVALFDANSITCVDSNTAYGIEYNTGNGSVTNNTVSQCYYGGSSYNWQYWYNTFALTVRGNVFTAGGALTPPIAGYLVQGGSYVDARLVGNSVSGGSYSLGGIAVMASSGYRNNYVRVDSNTVQSGAGLGMSVAWADSVSVSGNTVSGIDTLSVAGASGIRSSNVFWWAHVVRNTVTGNGVPGIRVDGTASGVAIDTNLIADNLGVGVLLYSLATGRYNSIRRNGTGILDSVGTGSVFRSNNIEGNAFGVLNLGGTALDADSSWWGDALGPQCAVGCDTLSAGDSISANVTFVAVAADTIAAAPVGAPAAIATDVTPIRRHAEIEAGLQALPREREVTAGGGVGRVAGALMAAPSQRPVKRLVRPRRQERRR
ncbi:MAG: right-handed parallel beta-helix repeat-containing protein, partial [Gemmatimonadales bacterium]